MWIIVLPLTGLLAASFFVYHLATRGNRNPHDLTEDAYTAHVKPKH